MGFLSFYFPFCPNSDSFLFSFFTWCLLCPISHLNGCSLETISRPSLLITDSFNASYVQPRRKQRDEQLLSKFKLNQQVARKLFWWFVIKRICCNEVLQWSVTFDTLFQPMSWRPSVATGTCWSPWIRRDECWNWLSSWIRSGGPKMQDWAFTSLALLNNVSYNVVEFSKSQVSLSQSNPSKMLFVWSTIIS